MNTILTETITANDFPVRVQVRSHEFTADLSTSSGGQDTAPGAHDYFDASLAICKAHTAMWYAKRKGIPLERVVASVERDDSQERQNVYKLRVRLAFHGPLTDEHRVALERAAAACPVSKLMTTSDVQIETSIDAT